MGVEARLFLIPRGAVTRPSAFKLAALVRRLVEGQWIVDPARASSRPPPTWSQAASEAAGTGAFFYEGTRERATPFDVAHSEVALAALASKDLLIDWPVIDIGGAAPLRYPLSVAALPGAPDELYYDVQLWLADDYIYITSETIDPFKDVACACGASLEPRDEDERHRPLFPFRLWPRCPECGAEHDVRRRGAVVRDGWTGDEQSVAGGAAFTCALVIDLGKCVPEEGGFGAHPDLVAVLEETLGGPVVQILDFD